MSDEVNSSPVYLTFSAIKLRYEELIVYLLMEAEYDYEQIRKHVPYKRYDKTFSNEIRIKYSAYGSRARKKKIDFSISLQLFDEILNGDCTYCGKIGGTIDRIDSSQGYTETNVQSCCNNCNTMKFNMLEETFLRHIRDICAWQEKR